MKILLVITKAEIGGAQEFVLNLARDLKAIGKDVSVAAGEGWYLFDELKVENINFFRINNLKRSHNPFSTILFISELRKLLKKENFSIVHFNSTNTLPGVLATRGIGFKIKTVFTVHGLSIVDSNYCANKFIKRLFRYYFKVFLSFFDKVVFVSRHNLNEAEKLKIVDNGLVIYNGLKISQDYFLDFNKARQELFNIIKIDLSTSYLIGSIGRLSVQKNYDFIINIWPEIKKIKNNAKLIIIGDGPEKEKYFNLIKILNLQKDIFLTGPIKNASCLLRGFDLFVLPSIYEGLPISLIEVLFADIPVLASNIGGNFEVIGVENCFDLNSQESFLEKLKINQHQISIKKELFISANMTRAYLNVYEF